jgi:hypothetical protein
MKNSKCTREKRQTTSALLRHLGITQYNHSESFKGLKGSGRSLLPGSVERICVCTTCSHYCCPQLQDLSITVDNSMVFNILCSPMSPLSAHATGFQSKLASSSRPWCLHTEQQEELPLLTYRLCSNPTSQPEHSVPPLLVSWLCPGTPMVEQASA